MNLIKELRVPEFNKWLFLTILLFPGCAHKSSPVSHSNGINSTESNSFTETGNHSLELFKGTIKYLEFEGGFFGIITTEGQQLLPINLDSQYHQNELIVEFSGEFKNDLMTIHQWGTPFHINRINSVKSAGK